MVQISNLRRQAMNGNVIVPATGDAQRGNAPRLSCSSGTLRFLVLYEDPYYLKVLGDKLQGWQFEVISWNKFDTAKDMLQRNRARFDILLSNAAVVYDIDRLELLNRVSNDMDISVAIMSGEDDAQMTITCIFCCTCYIVNGPMEREVFRNVWQHIHRRGRCTSKDSAQIRNPDIDGRGRLQRPFEDSNHTSSKSETKLKSLRNEEEENNGEHEATPPSKKGRGLWKEDAALQQRFADAARQHGGLHKAVPNKILELMKVNFPWLTRDQVASHLQKERQKQRPEKETRERNGGSHELPRDENSRNINMAREPQQHPVITGKRGQVISSNGPLPLPVPVLPQSPMPQQPLSPQPDVSICFPSLIQSEEPAVGFHLWNCDSRGEPRNVGGMDFDIFQSDNTIPQHPRKNTVSDLGMIATADIEAFSNNLERETNIP